MGARARGAGRFFARLVLSIGVVGLLLLVLVTQTPAGKEWVLREALARVSGGIRGEIQINGVSSPGLLNGFTFRDVTIRGEDGSVFLRADSVRTGISGPALLRGDLILTGVRLWKPHLTLEKLSPDGALNAVAIFVGVDPPASRAQGVDSLPATVDSIAPEADSILERPANGSRRRIVLRDARVHDGTLDVFLPLPRDHSDSARVLVEPASAGRPALRRLTFRELDLELGQAVIRTPGQQGERFELTNLSFLGEVWPDPIRVTGAEGELRREGSRVLAFFDSFELPASRVQGEADIRWGGSGGVRVSVEGRAGPLALEDLFPIENRLPTGSARGPFGFQLSEAGLRLDFRGAQLASDLGGITAQGGLSLEGEIGFRDLALELDGLDLSLTDPWVKDTLPLRGRLTGELFLDGDLADLEIGSLLELTNPDSTGSLWADVDGRMGFRQGFSATSLEVTLAPLEWAALASVSPAMTLRGTGAVRAVLTGSLTGDGLGIDAEITHVPARPARGQSPRPAGGASRVAVRGRILEDSTDLFLDLTGDLSPLSLTTLRRSFPSLPLEGEYTGRVDFLGPLGDLQTTADLETSGGPLRVSARFDARLVADSYSVEAMTDGSFVLSSVLPSLPEPTRLEGAVFAQGRGLTLDALSGEASVLVRQGEIGHLTVDSAFAEASVEGGVLSVGHLVVKTELGSLEGSGFFGVASDAPPGELQVTFQSESLEPLRPYLMEDPGLILDDLSPRYRDLLATEGVDLDTLATAADIAVEGSVRGTATLRGGFRDFSGEGAVEFEGLRFRRDYVQSGAMTISARVSPEEEPRIEAEVQTDSLNIRSLGYRSGTASLDVTRSEGRIRVTTVRSDRERYSAQGTYALESRERGTLNLDELNLEFDMVRWNLGGPALFEWSPEGYRIRDFQVVRSGDRSMRFRADGFLPLGGREGNFDLEAEGLNLARIARTLQMETPLEGSADFRGTATGTSDDPVIVGAFSGRDLRYGQFSLDGVESDLNYRNRRIDLELEATEAGTQVLSASGYFPLDLRIDSDSARMADAPVDLAFSMDSFPAALALAFMNSMEEVEGTLSGGVRLGGTRGDLQPEGELRLSGGSARFPGLGVRHRDVEARLVLTPDGVVQVDGTLRSGGTASVVGTVDLAGTPSNPALDLDVEARDFLAVDRRDVRGRVSGSMFVDDRYRSPLVTGSLTAQEGVLFVEEVARSVEVVDLSDPTFFDVVDTTLVTLRPIIRGSQNPFLQNLRLRLNLTMAQDSWLRGRDMNIEMAGALDVFWDRTAQDLTFLGNLNAVRGTYSVFNRQFQVQEGTVSFPGVPGINPDLDIRAMNRLRTPKNEQLEIIATVEGSLLEPRVSLSGNSAFPIADDDLVSYLVFGQPSHAVGQGLSRAASEGASAALRGATASFAVGLFSLELGQILARDLGLDYLAVTQGVVDPDASGGNRGFLSGAAGTQVEIGQYLSDDIFAALRWRPLASGSNLSRFAALRVESRLGDRWTLEGYLEDRFLRTSLFLLAFDDPEFKSEFSLGFFLYREWGY